MIYLSAPVSSTASERSFNAAFKISGDSRIRLNPANLERLTFLRHNLKALGFDIESLPNPPTDFKSPSDITGTGISIGPGLFSNCGWVRTGTEYN